MIQFLFQVFLSSEHPWSVKHHERDIDNSMCIKVVDVCEAVKWLATEASFIASSIKILYKERYNYNH